MKAMLIAGARPNFMKIAPILAELDRRGFESVLVHTGQHYDHDMSGSFFEQLGIREPDVHLGVGSGSQAVQTARIMEAFEPVLLRERPDWLVTVGDVNSTMATALVAAKLQPELGCGIAHVEAGLRSGDWAMPEEVNRVLTDRMSDLLLTPSPDAKPNLLGDGVPEDRIVFVGNVMIDTLLANVERARALDFPATLGLDGHYALVTLHRPSNVDEADALETILKGLGEVAREVDVVLPLHPRTRGSVERFGLESMLEPLRVRPPVSYLEMLSLMDGAAAVLTDSGGVQEETTVLGVPCLTLRETTERPVTVSQGTNRMAPWPLTVDGIVTAAREALATEHAAPGSRTPDGWDGRAAQRIVDALERAARAGTAGRDDTP